MYLDLETTCKTMVLLKERFVYRLSKTPCSIVDIVRFISAHERNNKFLGVSRDVAEGNISSHTFQKCQEKNKQVSPSTAII